MERDDESQKKRQSIRDKDNPSGKDDKGEGRREKPGQGMDEDLDAQKDGSYGHKPQDNAENNG